jgi:hypothetical protein
MMKCAVLLPVLSLPNQSTAFRKGTVFFLLPPFSTGCAKMVGFLYAHKSRAFELKHGAASRSTWCGLLVLSISRSWEKNQVRPEVVLVNSHDKSSAYQLHCGLFRLVCTNGLVVSDDTFQRGIGERVRPSADVGAGTVTASLWITGVLGCWSGWSFTPTRTAQAFIV